MKYKKFGQTDKEVSVIGFGGMRLTPEDREQSLATVRRAYERGINYFDTAPLYCDDKSEELIGEAIRNFKDDIYLSTKSSITKDPKPDDVRRRLETSLERLGADRIHFYHMWCVMDYEHFEQVVAKGGPYEGAVKARDEGLIDHICFSTHANGGEITRMAETDLFEGVTLGYNILNCSNRLEGIRAAERKNLGVVTMNPLGGGMIPEGGEMFSFLKRDERDTVVKSALRFNLSHPGITVVLPGMANPEEVIENTAAADEDFRVDEKKVDEFIGRFSEFGDAFCTSCKYCLPCPADINVPAMMSAYDWHLLGDDERGRKTYDFALRSKMLGEGRPSECTHCGHCEEHCTQHLDVMKRIEQVTGLYEDAD